MLNYKYLILAILTITLFGADSNAQFHLNKNDETSVITDPQKIYATEFPYKLREILDSHVRLNPQKIQDRKKIEHLAKYIFHHHNHKKGEVLEEMMGYVNLFSEKFFVVEIEKHTKKIDCKIAAPSYRISVFFSPKKLERFQFSIYKNHKNEYKICDMYWENMTDFKGAEHIGEKKYQKYWL